MLSTELAAAGNIWIISLVSKRCLSLSDFVVREITWPSAFWKSWLRYFPYSDDSVIFTKVWITDSGLRHEWGLLITDISHWAVLGYQGLSDAGHFGLWCFPWAHTQVESGRCTAFLWHVRGTCLGTLGAVLVWIVSFMSWSIHNTQDHQRRSTGSASRSDTLEKQNHKWVKTMMGFYGCALRRQEWGVSVRAWKVFMYVHTCACVCVCVWTLAAFWGPCCSGWIATTRPNRRPLWFGLQEAQFSGWVSTSALLSRTIMVDHHSTYRDATFAPLPWGSKVGRGVGWGGGGVVSVSLASPLWSSTIWSLLSFPGSQPAMPFPFYFLLPFKLFCFPKAMHTPVSQEEGSKLPGLPFRVLAVVNNTSTLSPFTWTPRAKEWETPARRSI